MERPHSGQARIFESDNELTINIPPKRNWLYIIIYPVWFIGWFIGILIALYFIYIFLGDSKLEKVVSLFVIFWLIGWTIAGFRSFKSWLWLAAGKEIISFKNNHLRIARRALLFSSPKVFDLREVRNFGLNLGDYEGNSPRMSFGRGIANVKNKGILKFDYGLRTVKIANGIDENEGRLILELLKSKDFID
ncbi:hypothetical protein EYV94_10940 [Puteibacter caeruleilacunae]|nr:hypothetical protein EYV94_10940 [Puteibacter caeruleilacunae]